MSERKVSTDALETLGTIHVKEERRDAIHLAVLPAKAGHRLVAGDPISIRDGVATGDASGLAIVDPFLSVDVRPGEKFWAVLRPRLVTSLRHVWSHPEFQDEAPAGEGPEKSASQVYLDDYAAKLGITAATLIDGGLSQQVVGFGAYSMLADTFYFDVGAYHTLGAGLQNSLGIDPTGETQVAGLAPYWRFALDRMVGDGRWEIGTFGMAAETYPGRDRSAGKDRLTDFGFDSQYQVSRGPSDVTAMLSWIYERQNWDASYALGNTANPTDSFWELKTTVSYLYDKTFGLTGQYFLLDGSNDTGIFATSQTGSPISDGVVLQLNYLPFNKGGGPSFWPKSNVKFSLQYTIYNRFDGARSNYDGMGANARDNNTLYAEAWIAF